PNASWPSPGLTRGSTRPSPPAPASRKKHLPTATTPLGMAGSSPTMTYAQRHCEQTESQRFPRLVLHTKISAAYFRILHQPRGYALCSAATQVHDHGAVGQAQRPVGVLLSKNDSQPFSRLDLQQDVADLLHDDGCQTQRRLVQEKQFRP